MREFSEALDKEMRLIAECIYLSPFEAAMQYVGQCEIHDILYIEVDPTNKKGCPRCNEQKKSSPDNSDV